ncbi:hypothetical protein KP509_22G046300 [Ceratopteris richardii]|nr:hypothetical protein KP509_22G046300 [Ceratopteris richardii]
MKTAFQPIRPVTQASSAKATPDLFAMTADLPVQVGSASTESLDNHQTRELVTLDTTEFGPRTEVMIGDVKERSRMLEERYADRKRSILVIGLSVHSCPVEVREKLAVPEAEWTQAIDELSSYPHIEEASILSTCNRLEVYVSALSWHMATLEIIDWMSQKSGMTHALLRKHLFVLQNEDASMHLFRVASGLDSLVLGEGQILSQVKHVMKMGQAIDQFGRQLTALFKQAIVAGKRVRTQTGIGAGSVSISSAAVELAEKKSNLFRLKDANMCIVGAGKMAKLLIKHLNSKGCSSIHMVNRSEERVKNLQKDFPDVTLTYHSLDEVARCIEHADIIFTCTASKVPLINKSTIGSLPSADKGKLFVDISVPRNVAPCVGQLTTVVVYNVDDLQEIVAGNKEERSRKAFEAENIIKEELKNFEAWQDSLQTVPTIKKLRAYAETIRMSEFEKCLGKVGNDLSIKDKKAIEELSRSIVNKLLHGPMVHLRGDGPSSSCRDEILENMHAVERMFDLNSESLSMGRRVDARTGQAR